MSLTLLICGSGRRRMLFSSIRHCLLKRCIYSLHNVDCK
jgi:hypothetical protein